MKSKFLLPFIFFSFSSLFLSATHIVGGSLTYEQLGGSTYRITLKVYRDCAAGNAAFDANITIEILKANGTAFVPSKNVTIALGTVTKLNPYVDTCVVKPNVCVEEALYTKVVNNLPPLAGGYHLFWQRCCRNSSLDNINNPLSSGESFYTFIPDNNLLITNSSPTWVNSPPTFVCQSEQLNFNHAATDADGDSLVYSFYDPYLGCDGTTVQSPSCTTDYPTFPGSVATFNKVSWKAGYSATNPLGGAGLTLSSTGLLNGIPPALGQYVMGVRCSEWRNGVKIGEILRDFQFNVVSCPPLAVANFTPAGQCSGTAVTFTNTTTPAANNYSWNFGNTATLADTSKLTNPSYTYPTLGTYTVVLITNKGTACADTAIKVITVSSITANFTSNGAGCIGMPVNFTDGSTTPAPNTVSNWLWKFGDGNNSSTQNPSHIYNTAGTFTVTLVVTSSAGCKDSIKKTVTVQNLPVPNFTSNGVCQGKTISFTNTTAPAANTYFWDFGNTGTFADTSLATNPSYTYPTTGTYTVSLTINKGTACAKTITKTITLASITANFTDNRPGCIGKAVSFTDSSTVFPGSIISWEWDFGDGGLSSSQNPTHTYIANGVYDVVLIVTSSSGCIDTITRPMTIQNAPVPNFTSSGVCQGKSIKFTNTTLPSGGTYFWDFGNITTPADTSNSTNPTYVYPAIGTYTVTLTVNKYSACAVTITKVISLSSVTADFTSSPTGCTGTSVSFTNLSTVSSNSTISSWNWDFGDTTTSVLQNPSHTYIYSGTYNVTLIVTSAAGCKDTIVYPITIQNSPVANAGNDTTSCSNNSSINLKGTILNATGGTWIGKGTFTPSDTSLNITYTPNPSSILNGKDTLLFYTTGNGVCKADTSQIIISFYPGPTANVGANFSVCKDTSSVPVCAVYTVATGGIWKTTGTGSFADSTKNCTSYIPSTADTAAGSVILYVRSTIGNGNCLAARDSLVVTFTATPTSIIVSNDSSCANGPITITVNVSTGTGIWTSNGTGTFSPNSNTLNGTYIPSVADIASGKVRLIFSSTNNGGCLSSKDTIDVTITPTPAVNAGSNISVCKDTSSVPVCASVTGTVGVKWQTMGTGSFTNSNLPCTSYIPGTADTAAGSVIVYVTTTNNGACSAAHDSVIITFTPPTNSIITSNDSSCASNPVNFSVNVSTGSGIWSSTGTGTFTPSNTSLSGVYIPSAADDAAGTIKLYFTSTGNGGCRSSKDTINVTLIPAPTAAFTNTTACSSFPVVFTDGSTSTGTIVGWNWNFGDGSPTSIIKNPSHVYAAGGSYPVRLIITSNNGCVDTITKTVNVFDKPFADFDVNGICLGDGTQFLDSTTVTGSTITSWKWAFGDFTNSTIQNPLHLYSSSGNYLITLIVQSAQGCIDTVSKTITLTSGPTANFKIDDYTAYVNQKLIFTDKSTNSPVSWFWDFGDSSIDSTSTLQNPSHAYPVGGIYKVCLIVTDASGCKDTICQTEIVSLPPVVPSGFSPNHDGENDIFYVYGGPFKKLNLKIFNNWGELIFESDSQAKGWDGQRKGIDQAVGVYVWIVVGDTEDDKHYELSGDVTLLR